MEMDALDLTALSSDASQFSVLPGVPSDAVTQQFLSHYPLPILISALERGGDLESSVILVLEKIFSTRFGVTAVFQALPYAGPGLEASTASARRMTCLGVSKLLERAGDNEEAVHALVANDLVVPLVKSIADRDASVAAAAAEAIINLAKTSAGVELLFAEKGSSAGLLKDLAICGSSLVRIRIFSLVALLLDHSKKAAGTIKESGIFRVLESELNNESDTLVQMNALELLYEIAITPEGARFLTEGGFIKHLISVIGSRQVDPLVRSQSMMVGARLISPGGSQSSPVSKEDAMLIVQIMDTILFNSDVIDSREKEAALDALGRVGISKEGAELLFLSSPPVVPPVARHIVHAVFSQKGGDQQMVGIHALASVVGSERPESPLLSEQAEASLKNLVFAELESLSKWTPADLIFWLLQQAYDTRLAVYRLVVPMVARSWFLVGVCSKMEIVDFLTDPRTERIKEGMEWRHACCAAMSSALAASSYRTDAKLLEVLEKLQAAVKRGPYFTREKPEAQPLVVTQERF